MDVAISTLAFADAADEQRWLPELCTLGITALEVAPTKRWPGWINATAEAARAWAHELTDQGLRVSALQAIVFGKPELRLFADDFAPMCAHFELLGALAEALGAPTLVFGAPAQRDPGDCANPFALACERLRALAERCAPFGVTLAVEPVAAAKFIATPAQALALAQAVAHPNFGWHLDLSAWHASGEALAPLLAERMPQHLHLSQPDLRGPLDGPVDLAQALKSVRAAGYRGAASFEILSGAHAWPQTCAAIRQVLEASR